MAVAFIAGAGSQGNSNSRTASLNATAATLIIAATWGVGDLATGITFNGSENFTKIGSSFQYNSGEYLTIWYLASPTSTTANVVASFSGSANCSLRCLSLSGTATTGIPDSRHDDSGASGSAAASTTSVADNCMGILIARFESGNPTTSSNMTSSVALGDTTGSFAIMGYSAIKTPAGTLSMTATSSNTTQPWGSILLSIAPPGPTTSIKTVDGLAVASVKTVDGLAIASVKTINGLA